MDRRAELINMIVTEINRIFGDGGFGGEDGEYAWLLAAYGVTEEEDVQWQQVCEFERLELIEELYEEAELEELYEWLEDDQKVMSFLEVMLVKYRSGSDIYPQSV